MKYKTASRKIYQKNSIRYNNNRPLIIGNKQYDANKKL